MPMAALVVTLSLELVVLWIRRHLVRLSQLLGPSCYFLLSANRPLLPEKASSHDSTSYGTNYFWQKEDPPLDLDGYSAYKGTPSTSGWLWWPDSTNVFLIYGYTVGYFILAFGLMTAWIYLWDKYGLNEWWRGVPIKKSSNTKLVPLPVPIDAKDAETEEEEQSVPIDANTTDTEEKGQSVPIDANTTDTEEEEQPVSIKVKKFPNAKPIEPIEEKEQPSLVDAPCLPMQGVLLYYSGDVYVVNNNKQYVTITPFVTNASGKVLYPKAAPYLVPFPVEQNESVATQFSNIYRLSGAGIFFKGDIPHLALATNVGLFTCNLKLKEWQQRSEVAFGTLLAKEYRDRSNDQGKEHLYLLHLDTMESKRCPFPAWQKGPFEDPETGYKFFTYTFFTKNYFYTTCEGSKFHVVSVYQVTLGYSDPKRLHLVQFYSHSPSDTSATNTTIWEKDGKPHLLPYYLPKKKITVSETASEVKNFLHMTTAERDYIFLMMEVTGPVRRHKYFKLFMFTKEKGSNASHEPRGSCWLPYIDSSSINSYPVLCHIGNQLLVGLDNKHLYIVGILAREEGDYTLTIEGDYTLPMIAKQLVHVPSISSLCISYVKNLSEDGMCLMPLKGLRQQGATANEGTQEEAKQQQEPLDELLVARNPVRYVSGPSEQLSPQPFSSSLMGWGGE